MGDRERDKSTFYFVAGFTRVCVQCVCACVCACVCVCVCVCVCGGGGVCVCVCMYPNHYLSITKVAGRTEGVHQHTFWKPAERRSMAIMFSTNAEGWQMFLSLFQVLFLFHILCKKINHGAI